jgi:hypothetical protein
MPSSSLRVALAALTLNLVPACIVVHDDGGADDATASRHDYDVQICRQAHATFLSWGCPTNAHFDCPAHVDLWDRAGCLEEDIAWWECIDAWSSDQCARGCDFVTPTDCLMRYCADHPEAPACASPGAP